MKAIAKVTMSGMYTKGNEYDVKKVNATYTSDSYTPWGWEERAVTVEQYEFVDDSGDTLNIDEKILTSDFSL